MVTGNLHAVSNEILLGSIIISGFLWQTVSIGAGKFVVPLSEDDSKPLAILQHFFDGLGMLHKFSFENGQVRYVSRYTAEGVVRRAKKEGFLSVPMFGLNANTPLKDAQDPCSALLGAQVSRATVSNQFINNVSERSNRCGCHMDIWSRMQQTSMLFHAGECIYRKTKTRIHEGLRLRNQKKKRHVFQSPI